MTTCKVAEKIGENRFFQKITFWVHYSGKGAENIEKRKFKKNQKNHIFSATLQVGVFFFNGATFDPRKLIGGFRLG